MKLFSHRGVTFNKKITENHMLSFLTAKKYGYDGIELDIHFCENCILVHHDRFYKNMDISYFDLQDAKKFDILTLEQALKYCGDLDILIDIKSVIFEPNKEIKKHVLRLKNLITNLNIQNKIYLSSFNVNYLYYISEMLCYYPVGLITDNILNINILDYDFISIPHDIITKKLIENCHLKNIKVFTWTVKHNNKDLIDKLLDYSIDGIIMDQ